MVEVGGGKAVSLFLWVVRALVWIWEGFYAIRNTVGESEKRIESFRVVMSLFRSFHSHVVVVR